MFYAVFFLPENEVFGRFWSKRKKMEITGWMADREAAVHSKENRRLALVAAAVSSWPC